ncbi:C6 transcription factor OefC [Pyricularia oryzae]|nr:C6 transcription factor OefC [Pyricularia oryzae]KAI7914653.1 C6 transcription factor OefC [Pyricularia oryzae]
MLRTSTRDSPTRSTPYVYDVGAWLTSRPHSLSIQHPTGPSLLNTASGDAPLEVVDGGCLPWSNRHSLDSDEDQPLVLEHPQRWIDSAFSLGSAQSAVATLSSSTGAHSTPPGHLSPINTSINMAMLADAGLLSSSSIGSCSALATAPAMEHSASSSSCTSWNMDFGDSDDFSAEEGTNDIGWEQGTDGVLTAPKPEPMDEDTFCLDDFKEAPTITDLDAQTCTSPKVKRPRGRPRKHPVPALLNTSKVTKGRSKTGCITCRKRKKKCDEAKPRCLNCEKNAVVCEGYPEKQIWKSARLHTHALPTITMQPLFDGLETIEDRIFWKHYNEHLSTVLTVESEHRNAFKEMLVPIATRHQGLMHSILSLSSKHLDCDTPYALNILKRYPGTSIEDLRSRSIYHQARAMQILTNVDHSHMGSCPNLRSAFYGQMLCQILENMVEGRADGQHRFHLGAYLSLVNTSPPTDMSFLSFITEFFQFHIYADELIRYPGKPHQPRLATEGWEPANPIQPARLLGVADGLFEHLCSITTIRNRIRDNITTHADPVVDYPSLYKAEEIVQAIYDWNPTWPANDSRERVALLYKQMMWVHLYRTIYPPSPSSTSTSGTATATQSSSSLAGCSAFYAGEPIHTPPKSTSTSRASSPRLRPSTAGTWSNVMQPEIMFAQNTRRHSVANVHPAGGITVATPSSSSVAASEASHPNSSSPIMPYTHLRSDSPPPIRLPTQDPRVVLAVNESLQILDTIKANDPAQTLLLIPCLVVGAACFAPAQQDRIRDAVHRVKGYTGLRNADRVVELLEELWRLMAEGEWLAVWDWQGVAYRMGLDFLCA